MATHFHILQPVEPAGSGAVPTRPLMLPRLGNNRPTVASPKNQKSMRRLPRPWRQTSSSAITLFRQPRRIAAAMVRPGGVGCGGQQRVQYRSMASKCVGNIWVRTWSQGCWRYINDGTIDGKGRPGSQTEAAKRVRKQRLYAARQRENGTGGRLDLPQHGLRAVGVFAHEWKVPHMVVP